VSRPRSRSTGDGQPAFAVDIAWPGGSPDPREDVRGRIAHLASAGSLDAANGDVLDAWLEGTRRTRHADVEAQRTRAAAAAEREIVRLDAEVLAADQRLRSAEAEVAHTQRMLDILEGQLFASAERPPVSSRERRRRPRPTFDPLEGLVSTRRHDLFVNGLLALAALGDLATFYIVIAKAFREANEVIVVLLMLAFAAASVGLMHGIGRAVKELRQARGGLGRVAITLMAAGWLTLGVVACAFRLASEETAAVPAGFGTAVTTTSGAGRLLSALLLAGLYLASGLLAYYAGFSQYHPRMRTYLALRARLPKQREDVAFRARALNDARQSLDLARGDDERAAGRTRADLARIDAEIDELKELVRVEVAGHLGLPEATTGLVTGRVPTPRSTP
jgi:hypothetical protein